MTFLSVLKEASAADEDVIWSSCSGLSTASESVPSASSPVGNFFDDGRIGGSFSASSSSSSSSMLVSTLVRVKIRTHTGHTDFRHRSDQRKGLSWEEGANYDYYRLTHPYG